jgi:hypothetical protein
MVGAVPPATVGGVMSGPAAVWEPRKSASEEAVAEVPAYILIRRGVCFDGTARKVWVEEA